jgi:hypothetical protein
MECFFILKVSDSNQKKEKHMQDGISQPKRVRKSTADRNEDIAPARGKSSGSAKQALIYIPPVIETAKILPSVALSLYDKATQLVLSEDQLVCYGCDVSVFCG